MARVLKSCIAWSVIACVAASAACSRPDGAPAARSGGAKGATEASAPAAVLSTQQAAGTVVGRLHDAQAIAQPFETVLIEGKASAFHAGTLTDEQGDFRFDRVPAGEYVTYAIQPYTSDRRDVRVTAGSTERVDLTLSIPHDPRLQGCDMDLGATRAAGCPPEYARACNSTDVAWLESEARKPFRRTGVRSDWSGDRVDAYVRLGELGTPESLAAIHRIREIARHETPAPSHVGPASWGSENGYKPWILAHAALPHGETLAVVSGRYLGGGPDLYLISRQADDPAELWTRPRLIPCTSCWDPVIKIALAKSGKAILALATGSHGRPVGVGTLAPSAVDASSLDAHFSRLPVASVLEDADNDGWTDLEEHRIGLDPRNRDTDGDGVTDGQDSCPLLPLSKADKGDEAEIAAQVFFVMLGFSGSRELLHVVAPAGKPVHFWGYGGPILYVPGPECAFGEPRYISWTIIERTKDSACVAFSLGDSGSTWRLRKIAGEWYVTRLQELWVY
jgi:hypothetical protein